jgi:L-asparagine transporter-like permease
MTASQRPRAKQRSSGDTIATVIMFVIAAIAGALSLSFSFFFAMATDACSDNCDTSALDWAYAVTWGGVGIAAVTAVGGIISASARKRVMWVWPTAALVLIIVAVVTGAELANSVVPHH